MKQVKRLLALFLVLAMVLGVLPMTASAAGDNMSSATSISFGSTYYGSITDSNTVDYYKINLGSSGRINLTVTTEMASVGFWIYNQGGEKIRQISQNWNSATGIGNASATLDLTGGVYYFSVARYYSWVKGNYSFQITFTSAEESFSETESHNNNTLGTADEILLNRTYKGQLAENDGKDFYKFSMTTSGKLTLTASSYFSSIGYYIYNSDGTEVWRGYQNWNSSTGVGTINETVDLSKGTYYFTVTRYYSFVTGNYSFKLSTATVSTNLATPSITKLQAASNGVVINWGKVSGAAKYRVYRKTSSGNWVKLGDTAGTNWVDRTAEKGRNYSYTVRCVSRDGKTFTSGLDNTGKSILYYLATPSITKLQSASNGVIINWGRVDGAQKYRVYRKTGYGNWVKLGDASGTAWIDRTAKKGVTYAYTVRCVSSDGKVFTSSFNSSGWTVKHNAASVTSTGDVGFTNRLNRRVSLIYFSPSSSPSWGSSWNSGSVGIGNTVRTTFGKMNGGSSGTTYDILVEDEYGVEYVVWNVVLYRGDRVVLSGNSRSTKCIIVASNGSKREYTCSVY